MTVDRETGEWDGDEPVMVTVRVEAVTGKAGSTKVNVVNSRPGQIGAGVDAGDKISIADRDGDVWLTTVEPLNFDEVSAAITNKTELHVPVAMTATVMMEGDFSPATNMGELGEIIADHIATPQPPSWLRGGPCCDPSGGAAR